MKVKNKDLGAINSALFSLGNHQGDISKRERSKEFISIQ